MALRPIIPLNVELWPFDCHIFKAIGPNPIPVQYWVQQLANELATQGFNQTDTGPYPAPAPSPLGDTLVTKIALLPAVVAPVDAAIKACTAPLHEHYHQLLRAGPR